MDHPIDMHRTFPKTDENEVELGKLISIFWRCKYAILTGTFLVTLAGGLELDREGKQS